MPGIITFGDGIGNTGFLLGQSPEAIQREVSGVITSYADQVFGGGEAIYARAAGTIRQYGLCTLAAVWDSATQSFRVDATEAANTANQGRSACVAMYNMTAGQWGWFIISGTTPINSTASLAANAVLGITAAGQVGANSAGKQVLNAVASVAATLTVAKANCLASAGATQLAIPSYEGWFQGVYLSGTGIAAGTTVASIDPSGRFVTLSAATTASVNGTVTATYNNGTVFYNVVTLQRPFLQGAIT